MRPPGRMAKTLFPLLLLLPMWLPGGVAYGTELKAFVGARIIDGSGAAPLTTGVVLVRGGRIEAVGEVGQVEVPAEARRIDLTGKTLIPGLINSHGHVGATRGLSQGAQHYTEENILAQLGLYARYGITTVFSLGGDGEAGAQVRDAQSTPDLDRARLFVAGPVVTARAPQEARERVGEVAAMKADLVKIRVDDFLGRAPKMEPDVYQAVMDEAHRLGLKTAVHLYYREDAKRVLEAGADFIAHSVRDLEVDPELIGRFKEKGVCLSPTLTREISTFVYESTPDFFSDPFFLREADPEVLRRLQDPERQAGVKADPTTPVYKAALDQASRNLKKLIDAGVGIAFGTDSGPPARFQGYFEHMEMELMAKAGLTPMQILVSATGGAAQCLGQGDDIGTLKPGRWADMVVLEKNPLEDIRNTRALHSVWIAGNRVPDGGRPQASR